MSKNTHPPPCPAPMPAPNAPQVLSIFQALRDGLITMGELEQKIRKSFLDAGYTPAEALNELIHIRRYYTTSTPLPVQVERDAVKADQLIAAQKKKFSRRKSARGTYLILQLLDVPPARIEPVFGAFIKAAGWSPGPGNKPNLQLLDDLMALFIEFEREGITLPRRHLNQHHINDGRLKATLVRHRIIPATATPVQILQKGQRYFCQVTDKILPAVRAAL